MFTEASRLVIGLLWV